MAEQSTAAAAGAEEATAPVEFGPAPRAPDEETGDECALFLTELPENPQEHPEIAGLQNLIYGDEDNPATPLQLAENMKGRGNDYFKDGPRFYQRALECYTEAIGYPVEEPQKRSVYFSNRAAVHLPLKNYGHAIKDCTEAIALNKHNIKAYYRGAKAAMAIRKWETALEFTSHGLEVDGSNEPLKQMHTTSEAKLKEQQEAEEAAAKVEKARARKEKMLERAIASRGIVMGEKLFNVNAVYDGSVAWADNIPASGTLVWPVLFLYPEYMQSDFVQAVSEHDVIEHHLQTMFPSEERCAWDVRKDYVWDNLVLFVETNAVNVKNSEQENYRKRTWKRVKRTSTLLELLTTPEYIVPHFPVVYVLPHNDVAIAEFLKE